VVDFQPLLELERLLGQSSAAPPVVFPPNSRYQTTPLAVLTTDDGTEMVYLRRRFVPPPEAFAPARLITVCQGDRLDNLASQWIGDPEMFWRLCDANRALQPEEMQTVGKVLIVPMPPGIPAPKANG
jgi:hypothetical protein